MQHVIGPNGEKRPVMDEAQSAVYALEVATGIREEEYVKPVNHPKHKTASRRSPPVPGKKGQRRL